MEGLINKILLLLLGMVLLLVGEDFFLPVLVFLFSISLMALSTYFENKIILSTLFGIFFLIALFYPLQLCFLPLVLYCGMEHKIKWVFLPSILIFLLKCKLFGGQDLFLITVFILAAFILEYRASSHEELKRLFIKQRDSSKELNTALKDRNRDLLEKQDYEIYLATLRERNRIAREIHDNVGHMLSRSILQIGALLTIEKDGIVHEQLLSMKDTLNQGMNSIRESVHDLHDDAVDLKYSIEDAMKDMEKFYQVYLDYDMSDRVPRNVKYCFISTIKEAMSNITKHSNGDKIVICVREHPGLYQLTIEDNGIVKQIQDNRGMGLRNMHDRVEVLNGTIRIHNENGFHIFISIPKREGQICE